MNFCEQVYILAKKVPKGKVTTYRMIAEAMGTKACRAVGNALNKNPYKSVPCHRVVKSCGEAGGFARGEKEKIRMLKKEGIKFENAGSKNAKIKDFEKATFSFS